MNRRHLLFSGVALALVLAADGHVAPAQAKAKKPYTPPTLAPSPLVGRGLDDLDAVLHGHVDLELLTYVRLDWDDYHRVNRLKWRKSLATPMTSGRPFAAYPPDEQAQMLMQVDLMLAHMLAYGYIHVSDDPYGDATPEMRELQATAWQAAKASTMHRWVRI